MKQLIKRLLPPPVWHSLRMARAKLRWASYGRLNTQQVFSRIYETGAWGSSGQAGQRYYSGGGSHAPEVVTAYVEAVGRFLVGLGKKPHVVDLGCGDFHIGSQIRPMCERYVACDIVPQLIEHHKATHAALDVDFRVLDITVDALPEGDVVFVRQVLQHLSNAQIAQAIEKVQARYKYLVLTEHLPHATVFVPNLDKPAGPDIRIGMGSGVVLTSPPFHFRPVRSEQLCEVDDGNGRIVTTLYQLSA